MTFEERIDKCQKEIDVVLKKYKLGFDVKVVLQRNSILPQIYLVDITPKDDNKTT